jgi:hypothetical protein
MKPEKLSLVTETNMFGTNAWLQDKAGTKKIPVGEQLEFDPAARLAKTMKAGYLFRSPNIKPEQFNGFWDTISSLDGKVHLAVEMGEEDALTAYARIEDKSDATMFAYSHNDFEKWSDEKTKESRKKTKTPKLKVGKDGKVTVKVDVETLGD